METTEKTTLLARDASIHHSEAASNSVIVYPSRFYVLAMYLVFCMSNQFQMIQFAGVVDETIQVLHGSCTEVGVNLLFITYSATYILAAFPTCVFFKRFGLKSGLAWGSGLNFAGALAKFLAILLYPNFYLMLGGQILSAVGQMAAASLPPMVSTTWFPIKERSSATTAGALLALLGIGLGYAIPPQIIHSQAETYSDLRSQTLWLYGGSAVVALIPFLGTTLGVPFGPPTPPSITSPGGRGEEVGGSMSEVWSLVKQCVVGNRNCAVFSLVFGIQGGIQTSIAAVLAQLLNKPYGISPKTVGITTAVQLVLALVFGGLLSRYVDQRRVYQKPLVRLNVVFLLALAWSVFVLAAMPPILEGEKTADGAAKFTSSTVSEILGGMLLPVLAVGASIVMAFLPVGMEFLVELSYPINEVIPNTLVQWIISVIGTIGSLAYAAIIGTEPTRAKSIGIVLSVGVIILVNTAVLKFGLAEDLKRLRSERKEEDEEK